jgi:hypothetical protein
MFELTTPTPVTIVSVTPRREMHGDEKTPALSVGIRYKGPNSILDDIDAGLLAMLYRSVESETGQLEIEEARVTHLPKLRSVALGTIGIKGEFVGWRLQVKYGIDDTTAVVLTDCKLDKLRIVELCEGGTVELRFRIGTSKIDERAIGQLAMMMDQEVPVTLTGPKVAEAIDGTVDAFKRDHPDAPEEAPKAAAPEAERGINWPFPGGEDEGRRQAAAAAAGGSSEPAAGDGKPAGPAAAETKPKGRRAAKPKLPPPPAVDGSVTDPMTAFVGAHASTVQ